MKNNVNFIKMLFDMSKAFSEIIPLGIKANDFVLEDVTSKRKYSFNDVKGEKGTLIFFICNHCPYVHHVIDELIMIANDYRVQGIGFAAISSNDFEAYPEDAPNKMIDFAFDHNFEFPYLIDYDQEVAKKYNASCTPDFYLYDQQNKLIYHGQIDDSRPGNNIPTSGNDLRNAIDSILYNRTLNSVQKPSMGCNIKWKKNSVL